MKKPLRASFHFFIEGRLFKGDRVEISSVRQLQELPLPDKVLFIDQFSPKVRAQAIRLLGRNFASEINAFHAGKKIMREFNTYLDRIKHHPRIDFRGEPSLTVEEAKRELAKLALTNYHGTVIDEIEALGYLYSSMSASAGT